MSKVSKVDLRRWQSFWHVDSNLISRIKFAYVFGQSAEAVFATVDNEVYGIGVNSHGCLGVGDQERRNEPSRIKALCGKKLKSMAAGKDHHVLAVTTDGELYVWGSNSYGQMGNETVSQYFSPQRFTGLGQRKIKQVACGFAHSLVLTEDREIFSWGLNDKSQVRSKLRDDYELFGMSSIETKPVLLEGLSDAHPVEFISCCACTSFALTSSGEVFGWGNNGYGELGVGSFESSLPITRVGGNLNITFKAIACGHSHVIALSSENQVFSWGHNSYGQVGNGVTMDVAIPTCIATEDILFADIGASHYSHISSAVALSGRVYAWGQLKHQAVLKPKYMSFGSIHDVFATQSRPSVAHKPITPLDDGEEEASLWACLRFHLNNEQVSDVKFLIGDEILHGHGCFLRMRSQYFRAMLSSNWGDEKREIEVQGYSYNVYRAYLEYLYTDNLQIDAADAMDLLQLADEYCEQELKQKCENFVLKAVTVENVFSLYSASKKLSAKKLEDYCFNFAVAHLNSATQTEAFQQLHNEIAKEFLFIAGKKKAFRN